MLKKIISVVSERSFSQKNDIALKNNQHFKAGDNLIDFIDKRCLLISLKDLDDVQISKFKRQLQDLEPEAVCDLSILDGANLKLTELRVLAELTDLTSLSLHGCSGLKDLRVIAGLRGLTSFRFTVVVG